MIIFTWTSRLTIIHARTRLNSQLFQTKTCYGNLNHVVVVNETVSIARLIERFALFNTTIHYRKNSWFAVHELIFILIFAFVAVRRFIWAGTSKVTFNITWAMIQTLKIVFIYSIPYATGIQSWISRWIITSPFLPKNMNSHLRIFSITICDTISVITTTTRQAGILLEKAVILTCNSCLLILTFWINRSGCCTICRLAHSLCQEAIDKKLRIIISKPLNS